MAKSKTPAASSESERFDVLGASTYTSNGEEHTEWYRVGRAFPNAKGGFNIRLRAVPVATDGEVFLMIAKREPKDDAQP